MDIQTIPQRRSETSQSGQSSFAGRKPKDDVVIDCHIKELYYGTFKAVRDTRIPIKKNAITAFIGPSGCGKSTVLRCLNRMNDLVRGFRFEGTSSIAAAISMTRPSIRSPCGVSSAWCFSSPIPFATSIYNNVAFGLG